MLITYAASPFVFVLEIPKISFSFCLFVWGWLATSSPTFIIIIFFLSTEA